MHNEDVELKLSRDRPLSVLFVEDNATDFELCLSELKKASLKVQPDVVQDANQFLDRLRAASYDIVLPDYRLPGWTGLDALKLLQEEGKDIPFILVTGALGDDVAVECIKRGASDYILKDRLARLPVAIDRALQEKAARELQARVEQDLRASEERYALAASGTNDGLWDWDLKTNKVYFSPRWKSMLGLGEAEIGDSPEDWFCLIHPEDRTQLKQRVSTHLEHLTSHFESEHRIFHKDGAYRWVLNRGLAVRDAAGKAYRMAGSQTDITLRKTAEQQLLHDAFHDGLTGLPNRALFMDRLELSLQNSKRPGNYSFAVLFLDLDRFKIVNDSLGHTLGDQLLVAVAQRLKRCLRPGDTVARFGGDEFAALLADIKHANDVLRVTDRIKNELSGPFQLGDHEVVITASIGVALSRVEYNRSEELVRDADTAMYRAKGQGRARHEIFSREMHTRALSILELESHLRQAIDREQLPLVYQPIVSTEFNCVTGVEALLRWHHPQRGLIPPEEFIPLAEETGLIEPIGQWVLRAACAQLKVWHGDGPPNLRVTVNLSSRQFEQPNVQHFVEKVLCETRLSPFALELEITERTVIQDLERGARTLHDLRLMGVRVAIDDFGAGASALGYLRCLPISALKIDRSFIKHLSASVKDTAIPRAIINLAHSLRFKVIAEGVETPEQLTFLRSEGCDEIQGYLFSPPVPAAKFSKLMRNGKGFLSERKSTHRGRTRPHRPSSVAGV